MSDLTDNSGGLPRGEQKGWDGAIAKAPSDERRRVTFNLEAESSTSSDNGCHFPLFLRDHKKSRHVENLVRYPYTKYRCDPGGPNFRTRAVPRDTTPMQSLPLMGVGALARGHTGSLSAQRPEYSQHTRREGSHLPSEVVSRAPGTGKNQLLQIREGNWSKPNSHKLKDPAWTFNHIGGLRLRPQGWSQLGAEYRYIWPLNSIREADHLMPYSSLVASTPEDTGRCLPQGIIRLSRKLFHHLPTEKRFCILESSNGQHIIYFEQPRAPYIWDWAPTSDAARPPRPWHTYTED
ncbi:unnamed protein product [Boreogadus saida]